MSDKQQISDKEKFSAGEYEVQLYGFTVDEFISDNQSFIMSAIKKELTSVHSFYLRTVVSKCNLSNEQLKEFKSKIAMAFKEDSKRIEGMIKEKIASKYRPIIKDYMCIPDNCLLRNHMLHDDEELKRLTEDDVVNLQKEIEAMKIKAKRNATFIEGLTNEAKAYDRIATAFADNQKAIQAGRESLETNIDTTLIVENTKKAQKIKSMNEI